MGVSAGDHETAWWSSWCHHRSEQGSGWVLSLGLREGLGFPKASSELSGAGAGTQCVLRETWAPLDGAAL